MKSILLTAILFIFSPFIFSMEVGKNVYFLTEAGKLVFGEVLSLDEHRIVVETVDGQGRTIQFDIAMNEFERKEVINEGDKISFIDKKDNVHKGFFTKVEKIEGGQGEQLFGLVLEQEFWNQNHWSGFRSGTKKNVYYDKLPPTPIELRTSVDFPTVKEMKELGKNYAFLEVVEQNYTLPHYDFIPKGSMTDPPKTFKVGEVISLRTTSGKFIAGEILSTGLDAIYIADLNDKGQIQTKKVEFKDIVKDSIGDSKTPLLMSTTGGRKFIFKVEGLSYQVG